MTNSPTNETGGRRRGRIVTLTTLCVLIVGVLGFNYFRYWSKPAPVAKSRTVQDFLATWHCEKCGHELDDRGAEGARTCPQCGGTMYIQIRFSCPRHGAFPVLFLYDADSKHGDPSKIRVADGEWIPYVDEDYNVNVRCPRCGAEMMPAEISRSAP